MRKLNYRVPRHYADPLDMMLDRVPDEATRSRIFVDGAAEFVGLAPVTS